MKRRLFTSLAVALILVATLSLPAIAADSGDVTASVTVTSVISITITDAGTAGIHFGSLAPGTNNSTDLDSDVSHPSIIVTNNGNSDVTLQIKGTDFGSGFPVTNAKYSQTYDGATETSVTASYATVGTIVPTGAINMWFWLYVPSGVTAGTYNNTISVKAQ